MSGDIIIKEDIHTEITDYKFKYDQIEQDYEDVKDNLLTTSEKLNNELDNILDYAKAVPGPKSYEALAKVVIAISTLNRDTAAVIAQRKNLIDSLSKGNKPNEESTAKNVTYNDNRTVAFNGSANDLLDKVMKDKREI